MWQFSLLVLLVSSFCSCALALDVRGRIHWNEHCGGLTELGQARVVLDGGALYSSVSRDGGFTIPNVPSGTYVLSVIAHEHIFDKLRIDVLETDTLPEVHPYIAGTPLSASANVALPYPIQLAALHKLNFYTDHQGFNLLGMFKNPMMMMMLVGGGLVFAMPYIMKNLDPEVLQDFERRQAKIAGIQSSLGSGDLKSGLSALMSVGEDEANGAGAGKPAEVKPSGSGLKQRSGKKGRR